MLSSSMLISVEFIGEALATDMAGGSLVGKGLDLEMPNCHIFVFKPSSTSKADIATIQCFTDPLCSYLLCNCKRQTMLLRNSLRLQEITTALNQSSYMYP